MGGNVRRMLGLGAGLVAGCLAVPLGVAPSWAAEASSDVRAVAGQGPVASCAPADGFPGLAGTRIPRGAVRLTVRGDVVDVAAVPGWSVTGLVVMGRTGYNLYRPGSRGLPAEAPWTALRAPLDRLGRAQAIVDGFACGRPRPAADLSPDVSCLRILANRANFVYRVNGVDYQYAGLITFPTPMVEATVTAQPTLAIPPGCDLPFSLASYETEGPTWARSGTQTMLGHATASIDAAHRSITLRVQPPRCFGQSDLYLGRRVYDGGDGPGHGPVPSHDKGVNVPRGLVGAWNGGSACDTVTPPPPVAGGPPVTPPTSVHAAGTAADTSVRGEKASRSAGTPAVLPALGPELAASGTGTTPYHLVPVAVLLVLLGCVVMVRAGPLPPGRDLLL